MKFSSKCEACSLSPIRKFHPYVVAAEAAGRRVLHLNIGQPDVETPQAFFDAVRAYDSSVLAYAPAGGVEEYVEAVQGYYHSFGVSLEPGHILATFGGSEALQLTAACILDEGDEVLIPEPFYPNYDTFIGVAGGKIVPIPTTAEEGYRFARREKIEPLITPRTKAIMVTNPGNPTGAVLTHEEERLLLDICKERGLFLVSDEVYREIIYSGKKLSSLLEFEDGAEHVIVTDSISKRFSSCGARVGALISKNKHFMELAMKICQGRLCAATLDQIGAAALYRTMTPDYLASVRPGAVPAGGGSPGGGPVQALRSHPQLPGGRVLRHGHAAGGRRGKAPVFPAPGVRGPGGNRHVRPRRGLLRHPRQGEKRGPHRLRHQPRRADTGH